jgi:hypothetical protein
MKPSLCNFLHSPVYVFSLPLSQHPVLEHPQSVFFPQFDRPSSILAYRKSSVGPVSLARPVIESNSLSRRHF